MLHEMSHSPDSHPEWDYHRWVLSNSRWSAFYDEHGRPVQTQGSAEMPPQPPPEEPDTTNIESVSCSLHEFEVYKYMEGFMSAPLVPRYDTDMPHDREANGSGSHTQPDFGTGLAASIFGTPPVSTVSRGDYIWDTDEWIYSYADAGVEIPRDRAWPRERRANAGVPPERWSPSPF